MVHADRMQEAFLNIAMGPSSESAMKVSTCIAIGLVLALGGCSKERAAQKSTITKPVKLQVPGHLAASRKEYSRLFDAQVLAQGYGDDGLIDTDLQNKLFQALREIALSFPVVERIHTDDKFTRLDTLSVFLHPDIEDDVMANLKKGSTTGQSGLDQLNERLNATCFYVGDMEFPGFLVVQLPGAHDLVTLSTVYQELPEVKIAGPDSFEGGFGRRQDIHFIKGDKIWYFVYEDTKLHGGKFTYYTYDPTTRKAKAIDKLEYTGLYPGVIYRWGIPNRRCVKPFASVEDLLAKAKDSMWWVRLHALDVIGFLLARPQNKRHGEDDWSHHRLP